MKGMCGKCSKRETCRTLCRKAEAYASQDYVGRTETLVSLKRGDDGLLMNEAETLSYLANENGTLADFIGSGVDGPVKFNNLSPLANLVVNLYYVDGLKCTEIAKAVRKKTGRKMSEDSVKSMLCWARGRMKSYLSP